MVRIQNKDFNNAQVGAIEKINGDYFNKTLLATEAGDFVDVQNPVPTNGDVIYAKDIWVEESDSTNWSGTITDLVDNLHSTITNTTGDDPKSLLIHFNKTVISNAVGLGANTGDFSNVKIFIRNSGDAETLVYDDSNKNTKLTNSTFQLPVTAGFNAIRFEFHTTDAVSLSNLVVLKTQSVVARIDAVKPDNTVTDINATAGGNLKVSLEEFDDAFNTNPLPVTNTGSVPTSSFATTDNLGVGGTFDSGVLDARNYSQVQTHIFSDQDGTIIVEFSTEATGTDIVRTLTVPYSASNGFQLFSAPAFTPYIKYKYTNGSVAQTDFFYQTKFLATALSAQILGVDSFIAPSMTAALSRSVISGKTDGGLYSNVAIDGQSNLKVNIEEPRTGFGELNVAANRAFIQATASYNLIPSTFNEFTSGTGTTGAENKMFKVSTGVGVGGYGAIQSERALNYKAGEAGLARFTGVFPNNVANSWQGVGLLNLGDELSFGYNGVDFGIWHRYNGVAEVRTVTVTAATGGGGETLNLTLNGTTYNIPLTSGTVQHNAHEIANWLNNNQSVWDANQLDDTVIVSAKSDGLKDGTYTYGGSTSTGTIVQTTEGVFKTSDFVAQTAWNKDVMNGAGGSANTSGINLDPTKGNVFQITYQYLGFGAIKFFVENPSTGNFILVHAIEYANNNTIPSLGNPSMRLGMYAVSLGSTTDLEVFVGSFAAFIQGEEARTRNSRAFEHTQSIGNTFENLLTIRDRNTYNGYINQVEIFPDFVVISSESGKNLEVELKTIGLSDVEQNFQSAGNNLVADVHIDATGEQTNGSLISSFTIAPGATQSVNLSDFRLKITPGQQLVVQARNTGGPSADVTAALTWYEDL